MGQASGKTVLIAGASSGTGRACALRLDRACWRVFGQVFVMTRGGPQGSTFTVAQFIYETAFVRFNMGLASAAGVILMLITLGFTVVQLRAMKVI